MTPTRTLPLACALLSWAAISGCAALSAGTTGEPSYAADAEENLARGMEALESKNFEEADKYFEHVRAKYPFLEAATTAELRLADTYFGRERYLEARDAYQTFVKLHPTHPEVDYAAFRAAYTFYKQFPSDLFLLPPAEEKDMADVRGALRAMNEFVRQYPRSKYVPEAKEVARSAKKLLAEHELYVASFYRRREKWAGVAQRLRRVVDAYPGLGFEEEALFGLYDAYVKLGQQDKARQTLEEIVQKLPGTDAAQKAQKLLGKT